MNRTVFFVASVLGAGCWQILVGSEIVLRKGRWLLAVGYWHQQVKQRARRPSTLSSIGTDPTNETYLYNQPRQQPTANSQQLFRTFIRLIHTP